eukprot:264921-Hanusia_phi.AAC.1
MTSAEKEKLIASQPIRQGPGQIPGRYMRLKAMQPSLIAALMFSIAATLMLCALLCSSILSRSTKIQTHIFPSPILSHLQILASNSMPNMEVKYDPETGVFSARNPETGAVTNIDTASRSVDTVTQFEKQDFRFGDQDSDVLKPVNSGDPHTYFPGWKQSPSTAHGSLDGVTESPSSADFRRHYSNFLRYLGSDGEDADEAAIRIYNLYPSGKFSIDTGS